MKHEHRHFESRLQRSTVLGFESWGDAPGYDEEAPLALETNPRLVFSDLLSLKGAAFNESPGQRPRSVIASESFALKARFILELCR